MKININAVFEHVESYKKNENSDDSGNQSGDSNDGNGEGSEKNRETVSKIKAESVALCRAVERTIREQIQKAHMLSRNINSDILQINKMYFRYKPQLYDRFKQNTFLECDIEVNVTATQDI